MELLYAALLLVGVGLVAFLVSCGANLAHENKNIRNKNSKLNVLRSNLYDEYTQKNKNLDQEYENKNLVLLESQKDLLTKAINKSAASFPHIAGMMADMLTINYKESEEYLLHKAHPAYNEAKRIAELRAETKEYIKNAKQLEYKIAFIKKIIPNIDDVLNGTATLHSENQNADMKLELQCAKEKCKEISTELQLIQSVHTTKSLKLLEKQQSFLTDVLNKKIEAFPYIATFMADFLTINYRASERFLLEKPRPAIVEASRIADLLRETKQYVKNAKILEYKLAYIEILYPNICDIFDSDCNFQEIELETQETTDRVRHYLTNEEYKTLSTADRNQLALDNYIKGRKSKWQVGRDYEMAVGHSYFINGYIVTYQGILKGFEDLGRDLIVEKNKEILIIQCKNWSKEKVIHEKHIFQLYGTYIAYLVEHNVSKENETNIKSVFITTTALSDTARLYAQHLNITVYENYPHKDFPRIKCNINNGVKIYHLPFDQQYDTTIINGNDEFFAQTVAEAESRGFRRAYKWKGTM